MKHYFWVWIFCFLFILLSFDYLVEVRYQFWFDLIAFCLRFACLYLVFHHIERLKEQTSVDLKGGANDGGEGSEVDRNDQ